MRVVVKSKMPHFYGPQCMCYIALTADIMSVI